MIFSLASHRIVPALISALAVMTALAGCVTPPRFGDREPGPSVSAPPGMRAESYRNVAFALPADWHPAGAAGLLAWEDPSGEAVAQLDIGTAGKCPDQKLTPTGTREGRLRVRNSAPLTVRGAAGGERKVLVHDDGTDAVKLRAWSADCTASASLLLFAPAAVADRIAATMVMKGD